MNGKYRSNIYLLSIILLMQSGCGPTDREVGASILLAAPLALVCGLLAQMVLIKLWNGLRFFEMKLTPNAVLFGSLIISALAFGQVGQPQYLVIIVLIFFASSFVALTLITTRVLMRFFPRGVFTWACFFPVIVCIIPSFFMAADFKLPQEITVPVIALCGFTGIYGIPTAILFLLGWLEVYLRRRKGGLDPYAEDNPAPHWGILLCFLTLALLVGAYGYYYGTKDKRYLTKGNKGAISFRLETSKGEYYPVTTPIGDAGKIKLYCFRNDSATITTKITHPEIIAFQSGFKGEIAKNHFALHLFPKKAGKTTVEFYQGKDLVDSVDLQVKAIHSLKIDPQEKEISLAPEEYRHFDIHYFDKNGKRLITEKAYRKSLSNTQSTIFDRPLFDEINLSIKGKKPGRSRLFIEGIGGCKDKKHIDIIVKDNSDHKLPERGQEAKFLLYQRNIHTLLTSDNQKLTVKIGDISGNSMDLNVAVEGRELLDKKSVVVEQDFSFVVGTNRYRLRVVKIVNFLVQEDYALFVITRE